MSQGITNSVIVMLIIMLSINVGLAFTQEATESLGSGVTVLEDSPLSNYHTGSLENGTSLITEDLLPSDTDVATDDSNSFTDIYIALRTFTTSGLESISFLASVMLQPAGFLKTVGVPTPITLSIQILWSMVFLILVTAWIMGRT